MPVEAGKSDAGKSWGLVELVLPNVPWKDANQVIHEHYAIIRF